MGDHSPQTSNLPNQSGRPLFTINYRNFINLFGLIHAVQFILAIIVIICVATTENSFRYLHEFGYILFIAIIGALYALLWAVVMILGHWPPGTRATQISHLIFGFIMSQFYLTAFACSSTLSEEYGARGYQYFGGPADRRIHQGYGAAAFFTALAWLVHLADVFISWYYYGGIWPQIDENSARNFGSSENSENGVQAARVVVMTNGRERESIEKQTTIY